MIAIGRLGMVEIKNCVSFCGICSLARIQANNEAQATISMTPTVTLPESNRSFGMSFQVISPYARPRIRE